MTHVHTVFGSARPALSLGRRLPFSAGRPICPFWRLGADSNKLASRRNLVIRQTCRRTAAMSSNAEKPLSATATTRRSGSQRLVCSIACFAQSVRALCRLPCASLQRADGASTVRNGRAQRRPANGTGNITASDSQRKPLVLTKWPCDERTASRYTPTLWEPERISCESVLPRFLSF